MRPGWYTRVTWLLHLSVWPVTQVQFYICQLYTKIIGGISDNLLTIRVIWGKCSFSSEKSRNILLLFVNLSWKWDVFKLKCLITSYVTFLYFPPIILKNNTKMSQGLIRFVCRYLPGRTRSMHLHGFHEPGYDDCPMDSSGNILPEYSSVCALVSGTYWYNSYFRIGSR